MKYLLSRTIRAVERDIASLLRVLSSNKPTNQQHRPIETLTAPFPNIFPPPDHSSKFHLQATMSGKKAKKTPTKKKNTSDLSEADAISFITALSKTQVGIKQIAYLLMKATKGSPNKKEVQKSIASSLQIMVGEGEDKKMVQKGKSVRVYNSHLDTRNSRVSPKRRTIHRRLLPRTARTNCLVFTARSSKWILSITD